MSLLGSVLLAAAAIGCQTKVPPPEPDSTVLAASKAPAGSDGAVTNESASNVAAKAIANVTASANVASANANIAANAANANNAASAGSANNSTAAGATKPSSPAASGAAPAKSERPATVAGDPLQGKFTLEDATKGLPKAGKLVAEIQTDSGTLKCELYDDKAPITVANFVGLARGIRPFKDPATSEWVKRPGYDNGVFHRIIKGFMIQGGDPTGTGATDGGYVIPDEVWPGASHDRRGLICMANRGKNTNSMQFFITDGAAPHLDSGYTIFGSCGPDAVIEKLATVEVRGDRAVNPPKIKKITVKRVK